MKQYAVGDKLAIIKGATPVLGNSNKVVDIEHKEGEVILLDFWATWCPPCQEPMRHNQNMLMKRAESWGKKVRIIGLSID